MGATKITCFLLFLAVGGAYAGRGLETHASGEATANAGRSLLQATPTCVPKNLSPTWSTCRVKTTLPRGASCSACVDGWQSTAGILASGTGICTAYQNCNVGGVNAGNPTGTAQSTQSGGISASTSQQASTTGTGSASTSVDATAGFSLNIEGSAYVSTCNQIYTDQCHLGGLSNAQINLMLETFVQSCANAHAKCVAAGSSSGGGQTRVSCNIDLQVAQKALLKALVDGSKSFIATHCSSAEAKINDAYVSSFVQTDFALNVWTKVKTFPNGGAGYAVSQADISAFTEAYSKLAIDLFAQTCACKPECTGFCAPQPANPCPAGGCTTTPPPNVGVSVDGDTNQFSIDYSFYQPSITQIFASAWVDAYNLGCGQFTSVQIFAEAYSKAVARITADINLVVVTFGNAQASAGFDFNAVGAAVTRMFAEFKATAVVAGCQDDCARCLAVAASSAYDKLVSGGFANFCINECKSISAQSNWWTVYDYESYHQRFKSAFAGTPSFTEAIQKLDADVYSKCTCGLTPPANEVVSCPTGGCT